MRLEVTGCHPPQSPGAGCREASPLARLRTFALPIVHPAGCQGTSAPEYVRLNQHPALLAVCEKVAVEAPLRQMSVHHMHHRCYRRNQATTAGLRQTRGIASGDRHPTASRTAAMKVPKDWWESVWPNSGPTMSPSAN